MADNVTITQGTGVQTSVATDDVSGVHYQKVKLVVGTDGNTSVIPSDATYGLGVDVKRITGSLPLDTDNAVGDAFGRLRVSEPYGIFACAHEYGRRTNLYEYATTGSGTAVHDSTTRTINLSVSTGASDSIIQQSREYFRYQPGKSQLILQTFLMGAAVANVRKRVGYFDAANGIFLEQNGTTDIAITLRTSTGGSVSDTNRVVQGNWNVDAFAGAGPSGITIDFSKAQILVIDLQWLGVGRVRVGFDINGVLYVAHEFRNANLVTAPYMQTANLPIRFEVANTAASAGTSFSTICAAVLSEGGQEDAGAATYAVATTNVGITVTSTRRAILSIRPGGTFNGIVNRTKLALDSIEIANSSTGGVTQYVELVYNPTFGGTPVWATSNTESSTQFCQHGDGSAGSFTGGTVIWAGFMGVSGSGGSGTPITKGGLSSPKIKNLYPLTLNAAGVSTSGRAMSIVVTTIAGTQGLVWASMNYQETR